ncbi:hypothetical protein ACR77J_07255 [Tissierella praeacuta]|uniref:hypothetical protein n=1 Tax=Tissierella praeacuta TaxID=43131 RepID=UPI003DA69B4E
MIIIINEYSLTVKTKDKTRVYKVYDYNETMALKTFINMCNKYKNSKNLDNKNHWQEQIEAISNNQYNIIHMEDFCGVREVV